MRGCSRRCGPKSSVPSDPSTGGRVAGAVIGVLLVVLFLSISVFCLIRVQKDRKNRPQATYVGSDLR